MGSWGTGLFSNDTAADLRDDLRDLVADGLTPSQATARLAEEYDIASSGGDANDFLARASRVAAQAGTH